MNYAVSFYFEKHKTDSAQASDQLSFCGRQFTEIELKFLLFTELCNADVHWIYIKVVVNGFDFEFIESNLYFCVNWTKKTFTKSQVTYDEGLSFVDVSCIT